MIRRSGVPGTISTGPLSSIPITHCAISRWCEPLDVMLPPAKSRWISHGHGSRAALTDRVVAAVEGVVGRRAEPHIPVEAGRWSLRWKIEGLAGSVPVAVNVLQRPDPAVLNEAAGGGEVVDGALLEAPWKIRLWRRKVSTMTRDS